MNKPLMASFEARRAEQSARIRGDDCNEIRNAGIVAYHDAMAAYNYEEAINNPSKYSHHQDNSHLMASFEARRAEQSARIRGEDPMRVREAGIIAYENAMTSYRLSK